MNDWDDHGEEDLRRAMELLFFAYREFTAGPDAVLADFGFGRAHHRALYFIGRHPGNSVGDLIAILRITKQSLARVLVQLIEQGIVEQTSDPTDRRRKCLSLTEKGRQLEARLTDGQMRHIRHAYRAAGSGAARDFEAVLGAMASGADEESFGD